MISKVNTYNFGELAEYFVNAEVNGREFLLMVQEDREYRFYFGHPSNGPLTESRANAIKSSLEADGIASDVNKDMYGHYFVRTAMSNIIYAGIPGYELVKNVTKAAGYEYCGQNMLFAVRRDCENYLDGLCEVRENTSDNYRELDTKYPFEDGYIIWWGEVAGDTIRFYWS